MTSCSAARLALAGCSVTCACCLLTGLPARLGVLVGFLLLRTSVDRQLICTGPRVEQLPRSTFHLNPRALRLMAAVSEITIARAGVVFYGIESRRLFDAGLWTPCFVWDSLLCVLVIPSDSRLFGMVFDVELPSYHWLPVQRWCRVCVFRGLGYCFTGHR